MKNKTIVVSVTKADIDKGTGCSATYCPVALAIKRKCEPNVYVAVGNRSSSIGALTYSHPEELSKFISAFDRYAMRMRVLSKDICERPKPVKFELILPTTYLKKRTRKSK